VDAPGEHAFFTNRGPALTYEGLRNDVIQVVIHKQDAGGAMRDAIYDDVEVGDDFEWREASDCWVRYLVERVLPDPTDIPLKVLAVRRYGYAYTGCSGMVSLTGTRTLTWVPPNIQSPDITCPCATGYGCSFLRHTGTARIGTASTVSTKKGFPFQDHHRQQGLTNRMYRQPSQQYSSTRSGALLTFQQDGE